jgi:pyrroloquinoline quinone (PQQ) biosynthesis protein C
MTVQEQPYPVVSLVVDVFGEWLKHRREMRMSTTDLEALVRQGPHAADELPKMLAALGVNQQDLARTEPHVLRDMERVCALCSHKRQCDRDLAAGTAAAHYTEYCGNTDTIEGLGPRAAQ